MNDCTTGASGITTGASGITTGASGFALIFVGTTIVLSVIASSENGGDVVFTALSICGVGGSCGSGVAGSSISVAGVTADSTGITTATGSTGVGGSCAGGMGATAATGITSGAGGCSLL